eukprot:TRINITY_DN31157_c0_g1_i1.p1 TRINITY_DN31157_c0_g1~~TRINITY_DN31157_c0_g1_i1.p1  ORF type:complete len:375 (+),score=57.24 TRINITY_DN31157_c0_g1_i1:127-1251(+)
MDVEAHDVWAKKLWDRMDRDRNGNITSAELSCDEFQNVLRSILVPRSPSGQTGSYGRAEMNIQQAMSFCMRKADLNEDSTLSFKELKSFLLALRNQNDAKNVSNLIFALFDLDNSDSFTREEFNEIYRYYTGHAPTTVELELEWAKIDHDGKGWATRNDYVEWLQTSASPVFKQHAAKVIGSGGDGEKKVVTLSKTERKLLKGIHRPAPGILPQLRRQMMLVSRPEWNDRLNPKDIVQTNPSESQRRKHYFSRYQSEPELRRFYHEHVGFKDHAARLAAPEAPRKKIILSTESEKTKPMLPGRHMPAGRMTTKTGKSVMWTDDWQTPPSMTTVKRDPGTMLLRVPSCPSEWLTSQKETRKLATSRSEPSLSETA